MAEDKRPIGPVKGAVLGSVMTAGGAVVIAQRVSTDVVNSQTLTLLVVAIGLIVGGAIGYFVVRARAEK